MAAEIVKSVERAFSILSAVSNSEQGMGVSMIADKTKLHTSTVSRLITTLEHVGALSRVDGSSRLILGEGLIDLVSRTPWTERMVALTRPYLREVATATRESVGLTQLDNGECHVFFQIESQHHVRIRDWTGHRFPLHVTSSGKLWMADWSDAELEAYFANSAENPASKTIIDATAMRSELNTIRKTNVAWTIDELEDGLISIAVPIKSVEADRVAAIYLSTPSYRFVNSAERKKLAQQMLAAAAAINHAIARQSMS